MLISIIGEIGSGKTLLLTIIGSKSNREIYSNYVLNLPLYKELRIINLLSLKDNIEVFIDEAYTWLESRTSSNTLNRYLSYIVFQSRKRTINIYTTSQMFSSVDIRFREQSNIIVKCKRINDDFEYIFYKNNKRVKKYFLSLKKAEKYFKLYDTKEIVEPNQKQYLEFKLLEQYPKQMINKISEIAEIIKPKLNKITHDSIKACLMFNGYITLYEKYIYLYLKEGLIL